MNEILNFVQMTDRIGTSGQPTADQFTAIANAGYASVINLAMPDSNNAIPDEGRIVTALGMKYLHIPVPFDNPTKEHLSAFIRVMRALEGEKIWVHCVVNARVSAFMCISTSDSNEARTRLRPRMIYCGAGNRR